MSDNPTSPTDKAQLDKITDVLAALVDETRQSKVMISDVIAQRTQYAADIKDLKASIDTTRRALDPEALGAHVADNIDHFMGKAAQATIHGAEANLKAADQSLGAANQTITAAKDIEDKAQKLDRESRTLASITTRLEERDQRSKYDWAALGCAMLVAAGLAGGGAFFYAKANIEQDSFSQAVNRITQDTDAGWCNLAQGQIINSQSNAKFCAVHMPNYVEPEQAE
ncbi:hypothetical protein RKLH11_4123 [Rhodobacteraceae bacterium KLH11]|nr:hypothetical protein RKLH11_4123 [Rhodobacteraceae bacterium KLH11]